MKNVATPFDLMDASLQMGQLMIETQSVMAMRILGMAGFWNVTKAENGRMFDEKAPALTQSALSALYASLRGERPDQIMLKAIKPLRAKTRSNSRRLTKRGPKLI